jgi:hypothetical protein
MRQSLKMSVDPMTDQRWHAFVHVTEQLRILVLNRMALVEQCCGLESASPSHRELSTASDDCVLRLSPPVSRFRRGCELEYRGRGIAVLAHEDAVSMSSQKRLRLEACSGLSKKTVSALPGFSGCFPLEAYTSRAAFDVVRQRLEDIFISLLHELLERCQRELVTLGADVGSIERLVRGGLTELSVDEARAILQNRGSSPPVGGRFGFDEEREISAYLGNRPFILVYSPSDLRSMNSLRTLRKGEMVYAVDLILPKVGVAMVGGVSAEPSRMLPWWIPIQQNCISVRRTNARQMCGIGVSANCLLGFLLQTKLFFTTSQRSFPKIVLTPDQVGY